MAYDEALAQRIQKITATKKSFTEKKMFGGLCFLYKGNMCCGIVDNKLMLRIGKDAYENCLKEVYTQEMTFTGKPMKGMIYVLPKGFSDSRQLKKWIEKALLFVKTLPDKSSGKAQ